MTEDEYLETVRSFLRKRGMNWSAPAADLPRGRAFVNVAAGYFAVRISSPHLLSPQERADAVADLERRHPLK